MTLKLKDIVNQALDDAGTKLASAPAVAPSVPFTPDFLKIAEEDSFPPKAKKDKEEEDDDDDEDDEEKTSSDETILYAMKLAEALDASLPFLREKMAVAPPGAGTSHVTAPGGVDTHVSGFQQAAKTPSSKAVSLSKEIASHGGGGSEDRNDGNTTGIETNRADYSDPEWSTNKEAALAELESKIRQAEQLQGQGYIKQAGALAQAAQAEYRAKVASVQGAPATHTAGTEHIARPGPSTPSDGSMSQIESGSEAERKAEAARSEKKEPGAPGAKTAAISARTPIKLAADPSSPQASGLSTGSDYLLSTEPPESKYAPGNEEARSMTKRDAKTKQVRSEVAPFLTEPAFSATADPALKTHLQASLGSEKISSVQSAAFRALLKKVAEAEEDPEASDEDKEKAKKLREAVESKKDEKAKEAMLGALRR